MNENKEEPFQMKKKGVEKCRIGGQMQAHWNTCTKEIS